MTKAGERLIEAAKEMTDLTKTGGQAVKDDLNARLRSFEGSDALGEGDFSVCAEAAEALEAQAARIAELERERDEARGVVKDTLWMAGRYADGRKTYAVGMYNDALAVATRGAFDGGAKPAIDGMAPEFEDLRTRADTLASALAEAVKVLADLLEDTQHAEHNCGDDDCPVARARAFLAKLKEGGITAASGGGRIVPADVISRVLSTLDNYAEPSVHSDAWGEPYTSGDENHPGLLAKETAAALRAALTDGGER